MKDGRSGSVWVVECDVQQREKKKEMRVVRCRHFPASAFSRCGGLLKKYLAGSFRFRLPFNLKSECRLLFL